MTPQEKLVATGLVTTAVAKFYFGRSWQSALYYGVIAIAAVAIVTWPDTTPNP